MVRQQKRNVEFGVQNFELRLIAYDIDWLSGTIGLLHKKWTPCEVLYNINRLKTIPSQPVQKFVQIDPYPGTQIATNRSGFHLVISHPQKYYDLLFL
ncbi:MAG: hypothetical protein JRI58_09265 [Deltaproteobacteria bacterium]|nr:hypothetical protein [Deltaproteobacteria bacterium]MBW2074919.1 hypothetical protein [Deltaproteobacteria bacterium]RLB80773.1 MAG: hypothetical protein DRH17_11060 [Deltaproteobacteria bacterium]